MFVLYCVYVRSVVVRDQLNTSSERPTEHNNSNCLLRTNTCNQLWLQPLLPENAVAVLPVFRFPPHSLWATVIAFPCYSELHTHRLERSSSASGEMMRTPAANDYDREKEVVKFSGVMSQTLRCDFLITIWTVRTTLRLSTG